MENDALLIEHTQKNLNKANYLDICSLSATLVASSYLLVDFLSSAWQSLSVALFSIIT